MMIRNALATLAVAALAPTSTAFAQSRVLTTLQLEVDGGPSPGAVTLEGSATALLQIDTGPKVKGDPNDQARAFAQPITVLRSAGGGAQDPWFFVDWWNLVATGQTNYRKQVTLTAFDDDGSPLMVLDLGEAWISSYSVWNAPDTKGGGGVHGGNSVERLTLVPEKLEWVSVP